MKKPKEKKKGLPKGIIFGLFLSLQEHQATTVQLLAKQEAAHPLRGLRLA